MSTAGGYWHRPHSVRWRRLLFQAHLWTGLALALYVVLICLSGSAIVFRREMDEALCPRIVLVHPTGSLLSTAQLAIAAQRAFSRLPHFNSALVQVRPPRVPDAALEIWYPVGHQGRLQRLIDPYSGRDLGDAAPCEPAFVVRIADLHDELLGGDLGTAINGGGAIALTLMCITGMILWWPGVSRWRRSLYLHRHVGWRQFTRDLHGTMGFWLFALLAMWSVSAIYLTFPNIFYAAADLLSRHGMGSATGHRLDVIIDWMVRLHFGRTFGEGVEVLWVILGLAPCGLIVTGALMWWNRVIRKAADQAAQGTQEASVRQPRKAL